MTDAIADLCAYVGVKPHYRGFEGQTVHVSREARISILNAMGFEIETEADAKDRHGHLLREAACRPAPCEVIVEAGQATSVPLASPADWRLEVENTFEILDRGSALDQIVMPPLPLGIHRLVISVKSREFITWVLARPTHATSVADRTGQGRVWGVTAALYGMIDGGAMGLGDYSLLGKYAAAIAGHGADFIGINPIHAMGQNRPDDVISPYSPSHRGFLNTWHIACGATSENRTSDLIDYPAVLRANAVALSTEFEAFRKLPGDAPDVQALAAFAKDAGETLQEYALFEALSDRLGPDWREWPELYRSHDAATLAAFERDHVEMIHMAKWAQWRADAQLCQAQARAAGGGMRIGLYLDLAVGPRLGGAETWAKGSSLVTTATLGAPPDPLGPSGQSWGLAPQSPVRCREDGYAGFSALLRAVMRHAGMIRIDHVLGLMRSFWIPESGDEGAYVDYPFDALLAVVAIESARSGTIVIGEDLGLVPAGLRDKLASSGIYGLDVLQYMRTQAGGFEDTLRARKLAACAFATHDTPTIIGFFNATDARLRHGFGGFDDVALKETIADRETAKQTLGDARPVDEVHRRLADANSAIATVQLDDIAGTEAQQNLPGTIDEYPNWRRTSSLSVQDIETLTTFTRLGAVMRGAGRGAPPLLETEDELHNS